MQTSATEHRTAQRKQVCQDEPKLLNTAITYMHEREQDSSGVNPLLFWHKGICSIARAQHSTAHVCIYEQTELQCI